MDSREIKAKSIVRAMKFRSYFNMDKEKLVEMYIQLEKEYKEAEIELNVLRWKIKRMEQAQEDEEEDRIKMNNSYNTSWTILEKVYHVLKFNKKPLNIQEIVDKLCLIEPDLKLIWLNPYNSVANALTGAVRVLQIIRLKKKIGLKGGNYALPEWLDEQGNIKKDMA